MFNENNNHNKHRDTQIKKTKIIIYITWSVIKRARLRDLNKKMYLFESLIKSIIMYGVENWGWEEKQEIEKIQGEFFK